MAKLSLYLHIPFCTTMCSYCAFNTYTDLQHLIPRFLDALQTEIRLLGQSNPGMDVGTIYFGGGTPSLLLPQQYQTLFKTIFNAFDVLPDAEISLEANPNDLTADYLVGLRSAGFNRLSIGMQSAQPHVLKLFERRHDLESVRQAMNDARKANFTNVSLDLIFGSPHQSLEDWQKTLDIALAMRPDHISAYDLMLKGGTSLAEQVKHDLIPRPDDDLSADMYDALTDILANSRYEQYEISNWSKPGYQSRHNLQYWRNLPYLGLGPGAHGFANGFRTIVMRQPERYIQALENDDKAQLEFPLTPALSKATRVDKATEMSETIMMGLRLTSEGIVRQTFRDRFEVDLVDLHRDAIDKHVSYGLLHVDDDTVCLTKAGRLLSNAVIRDLI